jgi:hypothetical protein
MDTSGSSTTQIGFPSAFVAGVGGVGLDVRVRLGTREGVMVTDLVDGLMVSVGPEDGGVFVFSGGSVGAIAWQPHTNIRKRIKTNLNCFIMTCSPASIRSMRNITLV